MTVNVPILGIKQYIEKKTDKFARVLVLEVDQAVKENTPVDSGRLRASWMIGQNDLKGKPKPKGKYPMTPSASGSNYVPGSEKMGNVYSIHNNLPYAEPIAFGTNLPRSWGGQYRTKKADPGWFELIAKNAEDRAEELWIHISGED